MKLMNWKLYILVMNAKRFIEIFEYRHLFFVNLVSTLKKIINGAKIENIDMTTSLDSKCYADNLISLKFENEHNTIIQKVKKNPQTGKTKNIT